MVTSIYLAIEYLLLVFLMTLGLVLMYPQHVLEPFQNPPFGLNTMSSFITDRFINVFANVSTRVNKFSNNPVIFNTRLSLVFTLFITHVIPVLIVWLSSLLLRIVIGDSGTEANVTIAFNSSCFEPNSTSNAFEAFGTSLFSALRLVDNKFPTFSDVFNMVHVLWLLLYVQIVLTLVYGYNDLKARTNKENKIFEETYPVLIGYSRYAELLRNVIDSGDIQKVRKLMVLTSMKNEEFYEMIRYRYVAWRSLLPQSLVTQYYDKITSNVLFTANELDTRIDACESSGHHFKEEFGKIRDLIDNSDEDEDGKLKDKKLFLLFIAYFDTRVAFMGSDRLERILCLAK